MDILEWHGAENSSGYIFHYVDGLFNISDMLFSSGVVKNIIVHNIVYGLVNIYVHEGSMYYHATSRIDFHNHLKIFTQLFSCSGRHMFDSHKPHTK